MTKRWRPGIRMMNHPILSDEAMFYLKVISFILVFCFAKTSSAQSLFEEALGGTSSESSEVKSKGTADEQASNWSRLGLEINGYVRGDIFLGKRNGKDATEVKSGYGEAALLLNAKKGIWGGAYGEIRFNNGYQDGLAGSDFAVREAYINTYLGRLDIRWGHQIIIWGRADGTNPTNNLTPRDMRVRSPQEDDNRLANFALRTHLNLDPFRLEMVGVPFFAPSHFPSLNLPENIIMAEQPDYPNANLSNGILAARGHLLLPSVELSISYLYGQAILPGIALKEVVINPDAPPDITLAFSSYQHQVIGADFSTVAGPLGIRGEFAFKDPVDYEKFEYVPMPELQYVLGVDREFFGELNVILQYVGKYVFDWEKLTPVAGPPGPESVEREIVQKNRMVSGQLEEIQHSATMRLEWKLLQETLNLSLLSMYNFSTEELFLLPKVTYDIIDDLEVSVGGQIYLGPDNTLFGTIEESQSAGYVELKASF
jgi:hypothetical protein